MVGKSVLVEPNEQTYKLVEEGKQTFVAEIGYQEIIIDCYGHTMRDGQPFKVKVTGTPKNCKKCSNRYHNGWNSVQKLPVLCNCLRRYLVLDEEQKKDKMEIKF